MVVLRRIAMIWYANLALFLQVANHFLFFFPFQKKLLLPHYQANVSIILIQWSVRNQLLKFRRFNFVGKNY